MARGSHWLPSRRSSMRLHSRAGLPLTSQWNAETGRIFMTQTPASDDIFARTELSGLCDTWAPLGPPLLIPAASTVPTLILAGAIDPVAEPHESRGIGQIIGSNAQWIEFPEVGHNVRAFSPCAVRIVADFIAQPESRLDGSCALYPLPLQLMKAPRQT